MEYRAFETSAWAAMALGWQSLSFGPNGLYKIWEGPGARINDMQLTQHLLSMGLKKNKNHHPWPD
jgi:hypothetical protein